MDAKESQLQAKILKYLDGLRGCKAIKVISANERGIPDLHVCYKGRYIAFEIKSPVGKVSKIQALQLTKYLQAGAQTAVIRNMEQVKKIILSMNGEALEAKRPGKVSK